MGKHIGIWLDSKKALIIDQKNDNIKEIESGIEDFHPGGGSRGETAYAPQDASSEKALLERKKHQEHEYFIDILNNVEDASKIVVFGPAETKVAFRKEIENNNDFKDKLSGVETLDSNYSDNQLKEWVRNYFGD